MARIQTYTVDTTLNSGDMIIGTDGAQGANYATKNFTVGDLRTFILQGVSTYTNDNVDAHLNVSSAGPSQVLSWNGSDYTWVTRSSFSGNYNDLTNTPTLFSGSYNDLTNQPTIPAGYTDADVDTHLNKTGTTPDNYVLSLSGGDYTWVAQSSGGSGLSGSGLDGRLTKWTGTGSLGNSIVSENAETLTIGGVDNAKIVLGNTNSTNTNNRIEGIGESGKTYIQFGNNLIDGGDEYLRLQLGYNGGSTYNYNFLSASVEEENNPNNGIKGGDISIGHSGFDSVSLNALSTAVSGRLQVSGTGQSSFAGQVTIPTTPVAATDAASKAYVDANSGGGGGAVTSIIAGDGISVSPAGGTGNVTVTAGTAQASTWQIFYRKFTGTELRDAFNGNTGDKITLVSVPAGKVCVLGVELTTFLDFSTGSTNYAGNGNSLGIFPDTTSGFQFATSISVGNIPGIASGFPFGIKFKNISTGYNQVAPDGADIILSKQSSNVSITAGDRDFVLTFTYRVIDLS